MAVVYEFYEAGVLLSEKTRDNKINYSYVCKFCKINNIKVDGDFVKIKAPQGIYFHLEFYIISSNQFFIHNLGITSNLITHLKSINHENEYAKFILKQKSQEHTPDAKKRKLEFSESLSPYRLNVLSTPKYSVNSQFQNER